MTYTDIGSRKKHLALRFIVLDSLRSQNEMLQLIGMVSQLKAIVNDDAHICTQKTPSGERFR
jgi:hypothetical protein